ncbi:transmembrane protein 221 [Conger conger]|uniref:transmembrane protein 221 n=1 Tax=Conger conger TaxID=82655 RepID=UPI002A59C836|nr:transmembrane protein 221 [Conger conger]
MTNIYSQRSLTVLAFLGVLSAIMSLLSVVLIFQLQSHHTGPKDSSTRPSVVPAEVSAVLMPVATVLTALSLTLNLSSVVVCLLHSYFTTEICKGEDDTDRADWFLLDSRTVRHVAVGLFCLGISVYLAAMSMYMLLVFESETGIASACVLASGILVLLVAVAHSLARASRASRGYRGEPPDAVYQNESLPNLRPARPAPADRPGKQRGRSSVQRQLSYPPCADPKRPGHSPGSSSDREGYGGDGGGAPRMHRTLSAESGLLQGQGKPWNGINSEMRTVLARKAGGAGKDSTLV